MPDEFLQEPRVAYFSMEIALRTEIPTYAGGLEVLGGDVFCEFSERGVEGLHRSDQPARVRRRTRGGWECLLISARHACR